MAGSWDFRGPGVLYEERSRGDDPSAQQPDEEDAVRELAGDVGQHRVVRLVVRRSEVLAIACRE